LFARSHKGTKEDRVIHPGTCLSALSLSKG
jgi:hypothetical protein